MEPRKGIAKLFDLEADPQEKNDLSTAYPDVFADLKARYDPILSQSWPLTQSPSPHYLFH